MSLWAEYVKERLGWEVIEVDNGFIAYSISPPLGQIEDFYVRPASRGGTLPVRLANTAFERMAKAGVKQVFARVTPGLPGSELAMRSNIHYGFKLVGTRGTDVILMKEIKEG